MIRAVLHEHPKQALCLLARSDNEIFGWSLRNLT